MQFAAVWADVTSVFAAPQCCCCCCCRPQVLDGPGHYRLMGIVSHMGSNTACGHYVAHVKKVRGGKCIERLHCAVDGGQCR
jgi:hypothetical protein